MTPEHVLVCPPIGIASMTVPVYIAEVSPPQLRGQLVTINTLFITGGQFIASVLDGAFSYMAHDGWRYDMPKKTELENCNLQRRVPFQVLENPSPEYFSVFSKQGMSLN